MLSAKLFAALSVLQVGLAVLESTTTAQPIDIGVHGTYLVVGRIDLQIMLALASACFALTYFAASRWVSHPLNNSLGLIQFAVTTIGFILLLLCLYALRSSGPANGLPGHAPNLAAFRAFDWSVVFPIWLRHARREQYMDHPHDVLVPLKTELYLHSFDDL
jgi:Cytochrome C and Quinol oxidase polypeptide I